MIEKLKSLRIYDSKSFFCRHKWVDLKVRHFVVPKFDSEGQLASKMQIQECSKCSKLKAIAMN